MSRPVNYFWIFLFALVGCITVNDEYIISDNSEKENFSVDSDEPELSIVKSRDTVWFRFQNDANDSIDLLRIYVDSFNVNFDIHKEDFYSFNSAYFLDSNSIFRKSDIVYILPLRKKGETLYGSPYYIEVE